MTSLQTWTKRLAVRRARLTAARKTVKRREGFVSKAKETIRVIRARNKAVAFAASKVGTVEHPAGSNGGPGINTWQDKFKMGRGPWCGAFVGFVLDHAGVKGITKRIVFTPFILDDARAGRNGFEKLVRLEDTMPGDLILMDFAPGGAPVMHVGMARDKYRGGDVIATIEGNTSSGDGGSQDNGGGVFRRTRPRGAIVGVARPRW